MINPVLTSPSGSSRTEYRGKGTFEEIIQENFPALKNIRFQTKSTNFSTQWMKKGIPNHQPLIHSQIFIENQAQLLMAGIEH